jgi:hypothetical protein
MVEHKNSLIKQVAKPAAVVSNKHDENAKERLEKLLFQRTRLLNSASGKLNMLRSLIVETPDAQHTLFYCAPEQIDEVCHIIGWEFGWDINRFTAEESNEERQRIVVTPQSWTQKGSHLLGAMA